MGDFVLDRLLFESPTGAYQDRQEHHVTHSSTRRVARIYQVARQAGEEERAILRNAARREYQVLELLDHPGILRADPPTDCEFGPVLFLRTEPEARVSTSSCNCRDRNWRWITGWPSCGNSPTRSGTLTASM
jgi:hypothetical protein